MQVHNLKYHGAILEKEKLVYVLTLHTAPDK